jgi:predicted PurR-regulated permease PerM
MTALLWARSSARPRGRSIAASSSACAGHGSLAALLMVLAIAVILLAPFLVVGATIADNADRMAAWWNDLLAAGPPEPPAWVAQLPLIGPRAAAYWAAWRTTRRSSCRKRASTSSRRAGSRSRRAPPSRRGAAAHAVDLIAFFFFRDGETVVERLRGAAERIAGERGFQLALLAAVTVRGVVLGILGTAIVQGVLAAVGFWIAGIKAAPLLGLLTFLLSPVPIGPPLVWVPAGCGSSIRRDGWACSSWRGARSSSRRSTT